MINIEEEKVPYKKFKDGDVSKASKKSKHKHIYDKKVLFSFSYKNGYVFNGEKSTYFRCAEYCSICGKVGDQLPKWGTSEYWNWLGAKEKEWLEYYPDAELINLGEVYHAFDIKNINEVNNGLV